MLKLFFAFALLIELCGGEAFAASHASSQVDGKSPRKVFKFTSPPLDVLQHSVKKALNNKLSEAEFASKKGRIKGKVFAFGGNVQFLEAFAQNTPSLYSISLINTSTSLCLTYDVFSQEASVKKHFGRVYVTFELPEGYEKWRFSESSRREKWHSKNHAQKALPEVIAMPQSSDPLAVRRTFYKPSANPLV